jgi:LacI family transcriptional regulator
MQAAIEAGVGIPHELALIGSGNVRYAKIPPGALSTINQQSEEIGERAAKLLLKLIETKSQGRQLRSC